MERMTADFRSQFTADGAQAVIRAAVLADVASFTSPDERANRILAALAKADLIIVPKPVGNAEAVREAVRTGNWSAVSKRDFLAWRDAPREEGAAPVDGASEPLQPGNVFELPPGTEIWSGDTAAPKPEQDNLALCLRSADDLADGYDCRVQVVGVDDARLPMSVEHDEGDHIIVTDRHSGRVVGLVQAWVSEYGDPIVPKQWLEIVLSAWDAAKEPQWAA